MFIYRHLGAADIREHHPLSNRMVSLVMMMMSDGEKLSTWKDGEDGRDRVELAVRSDASIAQIKAV